MVEKIVIKYKNKSYIIEKKKLESYEEFYSRSWIMVKYEPKTSEDYKKNLIRSQKKINELYLGYEY